MKGPTVWDGATLGEIITFKAPYFFHHCDQIHNDGQIIKGQI